MTHNVKVFLVDDDLLSLNTYRQGLENSGYKNIHLFLNGIICLNNLHQKPNIIFLNHEINDSSTFDLLKKIKQSLPSAYIILISREENIKVSIGAMKHGAFDYIVKGDDDIRKMNNVIERILSLNTI
ncbi:MAG: response regulator [Bacteroidetes bacterium]|nr:response regulator [Bacteroidota bacterium]